MDSLKCVLVEDHLMFQDLLLPLLQGMAGLQVTATARTAAEAIAAVKTTDPDLLILDLSLPDQPGLVVAEALQQQRPEARVIVLSGQASSFVCPRELEPCLYAVVDKTCAFSALRQEIGQLLTLRASTAGADPSPPGRRTELTDREQQVLALIGQGCSSKAIAQTLGLALGTVETHRRNLRVKLDASGSELVRLAVLQSHGH
jgi:hypothetical protein